MKKQLELDEKTALRLYPTAAPEFKELLEQNFGKDFFNRDITERINGYNDILEMSNVVAADDEVRIRGFNTDENNVVKALIKKMRTVKIYNNGILPKRGDRRWYPYYNVSSGFVFLSAGCDGSIAHTSSASRLCLLNEKHAIDYGNKFKDIECDIIDLR